MQKRLQKIGVLEHLPTQTISVSLTEIDACIVSGAKDYREIGILLGHPDIAAPKLVQALQSDSDPVRTRRFALILAFLGDARSAPNLAKMLKESSLDRGWNYCGMDQFGPSRSPTDSLLHAIAACPDPQFLEPLIALSKEWTTNALWSNGLEFSHVLALSKACAAMAKFDTEKQMLPILARVLWFHGTNVIDTWDELFANQPRDTNHNESRNRAIRELVLLAGILACGDQGNQARDRLIRYTGDWRGPLARYARHVLERSAVI
jgi:hypothetical protein